MAKKLGADELEIVNQVLANCAELEIEIEKARQCGRPVDELIAAKNQFKEEATQIKRVYFPQMP